MWTGRQERRMLTAEEIKEIEVEMSQFPDRKSACLEALKTLQRHRGWISDEALRDLSEFMNMTTAELDSVATFYNLILRKPTARHVILLCDSVSCWVAGYELLREYFRLKFGLVMGGSTQDQRFTLLPIVCLGACDHAPAMMIDGDLHLDLTETKIDSILEDYK